MNWPLLRVIGFALAAAASSAQAQGLQAVLDRSPSDNDALRLQYWPSDGWAVQQYDRLVEIRFPGTELGITPASDLLDTFEGRVADVTSELLDGETFLRLTLACDCAVALSGRPEGGLDIGIIDRVAPEIMASTAPAPDLAPLPVSKPSASEPSEIQTDGGELDAEEVRDRLLAQLERAAAAGIVELQGAEVAVPAGDAAEPVDPPVDATMPGSAPTKVTPEEAALVSQAPVDEPAGPEPVEPLPSVTEAGLALNVAEPRCFPPEAFELPEIVGDGVFSEMVSEQRRALLGEFDEPNAEAAVALARVYIAALAPEEAKAVLKGHGTAHSWSALYHEMADLLLGRDLPTEGSLARVDCEGDQALWRAAVQAKSGAASEALGSEAMAGRALSRLPLDLRHRVATALGHAAATESDWTAARRFEALATRAGAGPNGISGQALMLSAKLAQWHGEEEQALELLIRARDEGRGLEAAQALLALADFALGSELFLAADTSGLRKDLGTLATRARGSELGARSFDRQARLFALASTEAATIDFLNEGVASGLYPAERQAALLSDLVSGAAAAETSRPLGLMYLSDPSRFTQALEQGPFRRAVVRSLAETGVPAIGYDLLDEADLAIEELATPLGEAFLASKDPRTALEVALAMPEGIARKRLRASALAMLGGEAVQTAVADGSIDAAGPSAQEAAMAAALEEGDLDGALDAALNLLAQEPTAARAEKVILVGLQGGATEMPPAARDVMAASAPERLRQLNALFTPVPVGLDSEDPSSVAGYLDALDKEMSLIEGYLEDG